MRLIRSIWHYLQANFAAESERHIVLVPLGLALGIALYFALPREPNIWLVLAGFEGWLLLFFLCRYKTAWHGVFIAGLLVWCGFINMQMHTLYRAKRVEFSAKQITYISGRVEDVG